METGPTNATDSGTNRCPLCDIEDAVVETASMIPNPNASMRKIMAHELVRYGTVPDSVIYSQIAQQYNTVVRAPMIEAGLECREWTEPQVRHHFECHVQLVPRRVMGRDLRRLERLSNLLDRELLVGDPSAEPTGEEVDAKLVKKIIDVVKAKHAILRDYRAYQKEDMISCGVSTLWKSVQLGQTTAQEAQNLIDSAAMLNTAAGAGDEPTADELFGT